MWKDRVVPVRQDSSAFETDELLLFLRHSPFRRELPTIQAGPAMKARGRSRRTNVLEHRLVTVQGLARPVGADQAEHPMIDRIPLRRARREVRHCDRQS